MNDKIIYQGNSTYLVLYFFISLFPFAIITYLLFNFEAPQKITLIGFLITILYLIIGFAFLVNKWISISFHEEKIEIYKILLGKTIKIPYRYLINYTCIDGHRGYHINIIKYKTFRLKIVNEIWKRIKKYY